MFKYFGSLAVVTIIIVIVIEFIIESITGKPVGLELLFITLPVCGVLGWNWRKICYIAGRVIR